MPLCAHTDEAALQRITPRHCRRSIETFMRRPTVSWLDLGQLRRMRIAATAFNSTMTSFQVRGGDHAFERMDAHALVSIMDVEGLFH